ncbi:molecular chaperone GrpE [Bathymodiolus japonicus methanotrophic gill symbiont]|uniref:nucleotide exchange factor GrpE n=1 Tax=Bathymodiolus japonicus methanotrophic gill symbiont TaxID=113269 RepID=UPI001B4D417B|nr:nucleotide exchange factor GrpE [Bathymodiolus japonicus methanotrophic gill symbiont]GFO72220.1 molecular chaperone GrpE [Bathymodiolus japonicus methanotrophic gill symbiont]
MSKDQPSAEVQLDRELLEDVLEQVDELDNESAELEDEIQTELSVEDLQKKLAKAESKAAENWDKVLRIQAEMDNLKRRTQKDLDSAHKYGLEKFAKELLSVIDSLELGIQAATSDSPEVVKLKEGSELTVKQFESVFEKFNIEAIDPLGQPFDPEFHQAMSMVPTEDAEPNTVINVFQKGYILNGRLIRPAMAVVAQAVA